MAVSPTAVVAEVVVAADSHPDKRPGKPRWTSNAAAISLQLQQVLPTGTAAASHWLTGRRCAAAHSRRRRRRRRRRAAGGSQRGGGRGPLAVPLAGHHAAGGVPAPLPGEAAASGGGVERPREKSFAVMLRRTPHTRRRCQHDSMAAYQEAGTSPPVNMVVHETSVERQVHFQSSDWKRTAAFCESAGPCDAMRCFGCQSTLVVPIWIQRRPLLHWTAK